MRTTVFFLFLFLLIPCLEASNDKELCLNSLKDLFSKSNIERIHLKKFLALQAELTMHKLTYSMYRNDMSKERFALENQILSLVNKLEQTPDIQKVKKSFEQYPLSRQRLALIGPLLKDLLNQQYYEEDPIKKQLFLIGQSDLKILSIIGEAELTDYNGDPDDTFLTNIHSPRSVINVLKLVNSSIRNSKDIEDVRGNIKKRIQTVQNKMFNLIKRMNLPSECQKLFVACHRQDGADVIFNDEFLNLFGEVSEQMNGIYRQSFIKYGNFWLHTGSTNPTKANIEKTNRPVIPTAETSIPPAVDDEDDLVEELEVNKPKSQSEIVILEDIEERQSDEDFINEYLIQHVLDHLSYFVTRDDLKADNELTYSLARAIDAGILTQRDKEKRVFHYKGKDYYLPETWNDNYSGNRLTRGVKRFLDVRSIRIFGDENFNVPQSIPRAAQADFKRVREEQLNIFEKNFTFEFRGKLYDLKTGDLVTNDLKGLLTFPKGDATLRGNEFDTRSPDLVKKIAQNIKNGERSYIHNGEVYHISGEPISVQKEHQRARIHHGIGADIVINETATPKNFPVLNKIEDLDFSDPEFALVVSKALTDRKRSFVYQDKVYDLFSSTPLKSLTLKTQQSIVKKNTPLQLQGSRDVQNVSAILNQRADYTKENKRYDTLTGRSMASLTNNKENKEQLINHDLILRNENLINKKSNLGVLRYHFKNSKDVCEKNIVINKPIGRLQIFEKGNLVYSSEVLIGPKGDGKQKPNTTAGVIEFTNTPGAKHRFGFIEPNAADLLSLLNNGDLQDNRVTQGAVLMSKNDFNKVSQIVDEDCPFYVIGDDDSLRFKIQDEKLVFDIENYSNYSHTCEDLKKSCAQDIATRYPKSKSKNIQIRFADKGIENNVSRAFARSLEDKKSEMMELLGLSNSEYNELAKQAIAIMGVESGFGEEFSYKVKESEIFNFNTGQFLVNLKKNEVIGKYYSLLTSQLWNIKQRAKNFGNSVSNTLKGEGTTNSRGLTQIKDVRSFMGEHFANITEENLTKPENAAIATMFVLAQKYKTLELIKGQNSAITEENKYEYLYYLYSGSAHRLLSRDATPKLNPTSQEVRRYSEQIEVLTTL